MSRKRRERYGQRAEGETGLGGLAVVIVVVVVVVVAMIEAAFGGSGAAHDDVTRKLRLGH